MWDLDVRTGRWDDVTLVHDDCHEFHRGLIARWSGRGLDVFELHANRPTADTETSPVTLMLHRRADGGRREDYVFSTELGTPESPIGLLEVPGKKWVAPYTALEGGGLQIGVLDLAAAYR